VNVYFTDILNFFLGSNPVDWNRGVLSFQSAWGMTAIVAGLAVLVVVVAILYRRTTARTTPGLKTILVLMKSLALAILLLCLLKPVLITSSTRPRDSYLGILVDNSRSMTLPDATQSKSRGAAAMEMLYAEEGLIARLGEHFTVRTFAFDRRALPVEGPADLTFNGTRTDLAQAMGDVAAAMQGLPLAALVMVTDGADNADDDPLHSAGIFNARHIPVHVIGMGGAEIQNDIEISQIHTAGSIVEGGLFQIQATVVNQGYAGLESELLIEDGQRVVASKKIVLGPPGRPRQYIIYLAPDKESSGVYTGRIADQKEETNTENNRLSFLVEKSTKLANVLYIDGHPRNEYKFIRRALENDAVVRLKTYLMTGPQKYLRQNIESPMDLSGGDPDSEEALFTYDAVIFGDVQPDFFSEDQLAMTRAFVSRRGGGFLMLGGISAFDAGFIGTPVEDLLPVKLVRRNELPPQLRGQNISGPPPGHQLFALRLTDEGLRSLILRLDIDDEANRRLWQAMPMLQGINVTSGAKPGATVLAVDPDLAHQEQALPVVAYERYGRGRTMAVMTATTWRWQMLKPHEDTTHERFWRQMLRWLSADAPAPVQIMVAPDDLSTGDPVTIRARIYDPQYQPLSQATALLKISDPDGGLTDLPMSVDISRPGEYSADFTTAKPGVYRLEVSVADAPPSAAPATLNFLVTDTLHEMRDAALHQVTLTKIATAGGGQYYTPGETGKLIKDLQTNRAMDTVSVQMEVWDIPLVFFLLLTLLGLEWLLRRRKGLS